MARIKNVTDMCNVALDLVDQVLDGSIDPKRAATANKLMNTVLKAEIAAAAFQKHNHIRSEFFKNGNGKPREIGPKFEWDDGKTDSFGSYIGTKLQLQAWKSKGMLHNWKVTLDGSSPVLVGEGVDSPGMEVPRSWWARGLTAQGWTLPRRMRRGVP